MTLVMTEPNWIHVQPALVPNPMHRGHLLFLGACAAPFSLFEVIAPIFIRGATPLLGEAFLTEPLHHHPEWGVWFKWPLVYTILLAMWLVQGYRYSAIRVSLKIWALAAGKSLSSTEILLWKDTEWCKPETTGAVAQGHRKKLLAKWNQHIEERRPGGQREDPVLHPSNLPRSQACLQFSQLQEPMTFFFF